MRHTIQLLAAAIVLVLQAPAFGQVTFQNLNFEAASLTPIPPGEYGSNVPIDQALPGWNGLTGPYPVSIVLQNNYTLGGLSISIFGPDWNSMNEIIEGQYTVLLQSGFDAGVPANTSISQTGLVPNGTQSILLKVGTFGGAPPNDFSVRLGGQAVSLMPLTLGANYVIYGGNVSQFAGTSAELTLTAIAVAPDHLFNPVLFDSIEFSDQVVPEPSALSLLAIGGVIFGWKLRRK